MTGWLVPTDAGTFTFLDPKVFVTDCDPLELLERRAVLTPRPRVNLILYDGVLAPRAAWRAALVRATSPGVDTSALEPSVEANKDASPVKPSRAGAYQSGRVDAANVWA